MGNKKIRIANIVGTRPNYIKIAPLFKKMKCINKFEPLLIHTGQHYDAEMSGIFFKDLELHTPDIYLGIGSGTQAGQTAKVMIALEEVFIHKRPDLVLVVGDVNSTLASAIVSAKLHIPLAHVEAGLRSFDRIMPEEINRIVTDTLSDYLFTTCIDANRNLYKEGIPKSKVFFVGNIMIDTLMLFKQKAANLNVAESKFTLRPQQYALLTLHRPENVDGNLSLEKILRALETISKNISIIFPAHPRTRKQIELFGLKKYFSNSNIRLVEPLGYLEFFNLMLNAKFVLTDSGGIQEETTVLGIPCLTLRRNTERPITITRGTNTLVGIESDRIIQEARRIIRGRYKKGKAIELWDGKTSERIVKILYERLTSSKKAK